ncbi:hypothetical protein [Gordonia sihwensis]|uniref:hypothetical protein n=1 Tax=Gordonia sihwensis TaxID=173559 RepID=UPI003D97B4E6
MLDSNANPIRLLRRVLAVLAVGLLVLCAGCSSSAPQASVQVPAGPSGEVTYDRPNPRTLSAEQVSLLVDLAYDQAGLPVDSPTEGIKNRARSVIDKESGRQVDSLAEITPSPGGADLADGASHTAARGLGALIPETFRLYHRPSTSWNIYDPVANVAALIAYLHARAA